MIRIPSFAPYALSEPAEIYVEEKRAWQGAPTIARTRGGRLFVGFMSGGIYEPDPRNCMLLVYSDDGGESWSEPVLAIESDRNERLRRFEIELWTAPDGELWLFWSETPYPDGLTLPTYEQKIDMENDSEYHQLEAQARTYAAVCKDPDADELVFGEPRLLFGAVIRNVPFVTDSGRWLFPTYIASPRGYYEFHYSDDGGKSFKTTEKCYCRAPGRAYDEPAFYRMADGAIAAIVRTTPPTYKRMISRDDGLTWSDAEELIPAASQRPCVRNISDGSAVFIPSIHPKSRNGLRLMRSEDGVDFTELFVIEDRERVSYAEFVEDDQGTLYIAYDRERNNKIRKSYVTGRSEAAKEILFARIPRRAIELGAITEDCVRAHVISKARIDTLDNIYTK